MTNVVALHFFFPITSLRVHQVRESNKISQVLLFLDGRCMTGISVFTCLQLASFLITFAIVDVFVISGTEKKKKRNKNTRHNSLPMCYNGAAVAASLKQNTMDSWEDAVNKL